MSSAVNSPPELAAWARRLACRLILPFRCSSRFSSCHLFSDAFCFSGLASLHRRRQFLNEIGRAHVLTPVTNAHLVCRLLLEKNKQTLTRTCKSEHSRTHLHGNHVHIRPRLLH